MGAIRKYEASDLEAIYRICLETGASGQDATALYKDPKIVGHVYAGPYVRFAPESAFVLEDEEGVGGYVIGPEDSELFENLLEREWWPALRNQYSKPNGGHREWNHDERMAFLIHHPQRTPQHIAANYPAHLHIDLLPRFQGEGFGRRMLDTWIGYMNRRGARGFHLGVGTANTRAIRFYRAFGLDEIETFGSPPSAIYFGKTLKEQI